MGLCGEGRFRKDLSVLGNEKDAWVSCCYESFHVKINQSFTKTKICHGFVLDKVPSFDANPIWADLRYRIVFMSFSERMIICNLMSDPCLRRFINRSSKWFLWHQSKLFFPTRGFWLVCPT